MDIELNDLRAKMTELTKLRDALSIELDANKEATKGPMKRLLFALAKTEVLLQKQKAEVKIHSTYCSLALDK